MVQPAELPRRDRPEDCRLALPRMPIATLFPRLPGAGRWAADRRNRKGPEADNRHQGLTSPIDPEPRLDGADRHRRPAFPRQPAVTT